MIADSTATTASIATLTTVARVWRGDVDTADQALPTPAVVVEALLAAETVAKQTRITYPFAALIGDWRLCFVTGTRRARQRGGILLGKGRYLPRLISIQLSIADRPAADPAQPTRGVIGNQVQLGLLSLCLSGPAQYPGKKNLLGFDFTQFQIQVGQRSLFRGDMRGGQAQVERFDQLSIGKLPFFAFFLVTPDLIAARGRGGGLAIWVRLPQQVKS